MNPLEQSEGVYPNNALDQVDQPGSDGSATVTPGTRIASEADRSLPPLPPPGDLVDPRFYRYPPPGSFGADEASSSSYPPPALGYPAPPLASELPPRSQLSRPSPRSSMSALDISSASGSSAAPGSSSRTGSIRRVGGKANVAAACGPCKRAHLACDVARPCKRCINMGKEEQCEDVPHKKRGRPKVVRPALGEPYSRVRPPADDSAPGWRGGTSSSYSGPYGHSSLSSTSNSDPSTAHHSYTSPAQPLLNAPPDTQSRTRSPRSIEPDPSTHALSPPTLFTVFATTELRILRVTHASQQLTGYLPHEFANLSLLDWVHPADKHVLDLDRQQLVAAPYADGAQLRTDQREIQAGMMQLSERELVSPAEGMREPYPNRNVRILRSDGHWSVFNVRLHLGGAFGGSIWRPETTTRLYVVASLLLISPPPPAESAPSSRRSASQLPHPSTPITPLPYPSNSAPPSTAYLPSLSSIVPHHVGAGGRYESTSSPHQGFYQPRATPTSAIALHLQYPHHRHAMPLESDRLASPRYGAVLPPPHAHLQGPPPGDIAEGDRRHAQEEWAASRQSLAPIPPQPPPQPPEYGRRTWEL